MIVTTNEAARMVGVKPATIRKWVQRGHLEPLHPEWTSKTLVFDEQAVTECEMARRSKAKAARIRQLAETWRVGGQR